MFCFVTLHVVAHLQASVLAVAGGVVAVLAAAVPRGEERFAVRALDRCVLNRLACSCQCFLHERRRPTGMESCGPSGAGDQSCACIRLPCYPVPGCLGGSRYRLRFHPARASACVFALWHGRDSHWRLLSEWSLLGVMWSQSVPVPLHAGWCVVAWHWLLALRCTVRRSVSQLVGSWRRVLRCHCPLMASPPNG